MYDKVVRVLDNLGLSEEYKDKFFENDLDDNSIREWIGSPVLAESYLQSIIPSLGHRIKFIKEFNNLVVDGMQDGEGSPRNEDKSLDGEHGNRQKYRRMSENRRSCAEVRIPASRQEVIARATSEAIDTYTLLMSVIESSLSTKRLGNYLAECFFERYSRAAEKKALQVFNSRCEVADVGKLEYERNKLMQLIKFKKEKIIRPKLVQEANCEVELESRVMNIVNRHKKEIETKLKDLNSSTNLEELEKIHSKMNREIMDEFDRLEPRSTVFREAREHLIEKINQEFQALKTQSNMDTATGQKYCMWLSTIKPKQSVWDSQNRMVTHAATEAIAAYTMLMNVMEESFEIFSEEFLDEDILEKFSLASEERAMRLFIDLCGMANPQVLEELKSIIKSKKEDLIYPNYLRRTEARKSMQMEVEGSAENYKQEMESKLKEFGEGKKITASELERIHDAVHQARMHQFEESEPRNKFFKGAKSKLINRLEEESSAFKAALECARDKIAAQGNDLVESIVKSYFDTMKGAPPKEDPTYQQYHQVAKTVCVKTVENAMKQQNDTVKQMFINQVTSKIDGFCNAA